MFEDSTFESAGRIRTRSRGWMLAALALNSSILITLIVIPLMHPEALRYIDDFHRITVPPLSVEHPKPIARQEHAVATTAQPYINPFIAPRIIPSQLPAHDTQPGPPNIDVSQIGDSSPNGVIGSDNPFSTSRPPSVVQQAPAKPLRISSSVIGQPLERTLPVFPAIAKATGTQGTVVLQAIISKTGTIENLRVVGGPGLLQQAALDAVKQWRYRPYKLNDQPVEVETTINVVFTLGR
jgi:periplasmic protein TonB